MSGQYKPEPDVEYFSVYQFFVNGDYERVREWVPIEEAMAAARHYTNNVAVKMGITTCVIITDFWGSDGVRVEERGGDNMAIGGEGQNVIAQIPLVDQIAEVKREIKMRRNVYTEMIAKNRISPDDAAVRTERMMAVQETLEKLRAQELAALPQMS